MSADVVGDGPFLIDADVHCPSPTTADLLPHLSTHWQDYLSWTKFNPRAVGRVYPNWTGMSSGVSSEAANATAREELEANVFDRSSLAIMQAYFGVESVQHPYLAPDLAAGVNRWLAAEWLDRDERLRGSATVAPQFAAASAKEVNRVAEDPRFVQIVVPARSTDPYGHHRYWPIWEAAAANNLVVGITYGGSVPMPGNALNWMETYFEEYSAGTQPFQTHVTSLIMNGVFEEWPNLRFAFIDSGWTWLPALCWRLDKEWKESRQEVPWVRRPPSEYAKENIRLTTQPADAPSDPRHLAQLMRHLPLSDMLMYSSDYPRSRTASIGTVNVSLDDEQRARVMSGNAADLYGLPSAMPAVAN